MIQGEKLRWFAIDEPQAGRAGKVLGMHHDARVDSLVAQLQMTDEQFALFKSGQLTHLSTGFLWSKARLTWWQRLKRWVRRVVMRVAGWLP